jgi:hypothetical protein
LHFWKVKVKEEKTNQAGKNCSLLPPKKRNKEQFEAEKGISYRKKRERK